MSGPASTSSADAHKQAVAHAFTRMVDAYGTVLGYFQHFGERMVDLAGVTAGMRVLDVAAGKGASAVPLRDRGAEVVAVDLAPGMVDHLRMLGLDARVMDAEALAFEDDSFDAVVCGFGIFFCPDPLQAAREFRRVVRPGGVVACSAPMRTVPDSVIALRELFEARARPADFDLPRTPVDIAAVLSEAGIADVAAHDEAVDLTFESGEHLWEFFVATGVRRLTDRLSLADADELHRRVVDGMGDEPLTVSMTARFWAGKG